MFHAITKHVANTVRGKGGTSYTIHLCIGIIHLLHYRECNFTIGIKDFLTLKFLLPRLRILNFGSPNALGLSVVKIDHIEWETAKGPIIHVLGGDLMNGTPIYDIKPYLVYTDCCPDAHCGFVDQRSWEKLKVIIPSSIASRFSSEQLQVLKHSLELDPRPHYHHDPTKVYGLLFEGHDIHFKVEDGILNVL